MKKKNDAFKTFLNKLSVYTDKPTLTLIATGGVLVGAGATLVKKGYDFIDALKASKEFHKKK